MSKNICGGGLIRVEHKLKCLDTEITITHDPSRVSSISVNDGYFLVDKRLFSIYGKELRPSKHAFTAFKGGEKIKRFKYLKKLFKDMSSRGIERTALFTAMGGGTITDLGALAASLYKRGMPLQLRPTTLVGQVDAAIGGKTAINGGKSKNGIGSFYFPKEVFINTAYLDTLNRRDFVSGLIETVKYGFISDISIFDRLMGKDVDEVMRDKAELLNIVKRAVEIKCSFISEDPYDIGVRMNLNLGHTWGHALETASSYRLRHGEAVGLGILAAMRMSEKMGFPLGGLPGYFSGYLCRIGLDTRLFDKYRKKALRFITGDKKKSNGDIRFILPVEPGRTEIFSFSHIDEIAKLV